MDEDVMKLRSIDSIKKIVFRRRRNETTLPSDLTLAGSEVHTVGAATEKARVPAFVFTRGMSRGLLRLERSCLEFLAGVNIEFRYAGCVDESA